ncbi:patatin-like phospholipase family protein [Williamsia sterculiae]|uniref:NTE family protein n=1 Tax=Williamsia sterculiae TaxID=1344003 RepID=A0A1N7EQQ6_9NOCA|nr:patatin-like phospholipase family protein [Williamsia sterculiae]SIR90428.1 NTE family protein [Williamsia sterculiae]
MSAFGLCIGCGGTIGGAWSVAALAALAEATGLDPRDAAVLQGTSAGAEIVTMLAGGYSVGDLVAMQSGAPRDHVLTAHLADTPSGIPPVPRPRLTAPKSILRNRGSGGHAAIAGLAPHGNGDNTWLRRLADVVAGPGEWLPHPGARLVAYAPTTGERVAFGSAGAPTSTAADALAASWAVPGWMPPVTIGDRKYVDGGAASTASVDLIDTSSLDAFYVITPMASPPGVRAPGLAGRIEDQLLRRPMSAVLERELDAVRGAGVAVTWIHPASDDMAVLGANFMRRGHRADAFAGARSTARSRVTEALSTDERRV